MVSITFFGNVAERTHSLRIDGKAAGLIAYVKKWKVNKKVAAEKAKKVEEHVLKSEEAKKKAKNELALACSEHSCYLQKVLPAAFDQARKQVVADYVDTRFEAWLFAECKEGMRDMNASFTLANPNLIGLDWSVMPEISGETQVGDNDGIVVRDREEGKVVGGVWVAEESEAATEPR